MFNILPFIISLFLINSQQQSNQKTVAFTLDNPSERVVWERIRLADPITGEIPKNIRKKEKC